MTVDTEIAALVAFAARVQTKLTVLTKALVDNGVISTADLGAAEKEVDAKRRVGETMGEFWRAVEEFELQHED